MSSYIRITKTCKFCKTEFEARTITTRYCSHSCNSKAYKQNNRNKKVQDAKKTQQVNPTGKLHNIFDHSTIQNKELLTIKETCAFVQAPNKLESFLIMVW